MHFKIVEKSQAEMVRNWLQQDYVAEFWYGIGLQNTLTSLADFVDGKSALFTHWIAYDEEVPFGFLMTSEVDLKKDELYAKYCSSNAKAITLDLLIGQTSHLGRGLGSRMIDEFLRQEFCDVTDVFIDPETKNSKAIHVYEKAGFKKLTEFTPDWDRTHRSLLMRKSFKKVW